MSALSNDKQYAETKGDVPGPKNTGGKDGKGRET